MDEKRVLVKPAFRQTNVRRNTCFESPAEGELFLSRGSAFSQPGNQALAGIRCEDLPCLFPQIRVKNRPYEHY